MSNDLTQRLAKIWGALDPVDEWREDISEAIDALIEQAREVRALRAAVLAERKACAALCDQRSADHWHDYKNGPLGVKGSARSEHRSDEAEQCAAAIRARQAVTP